MEMLIVCPEYYSMIKYVNTIMEMWVIYLKFIEKIVFIIELLYQAKNKKCKLKIKIYNIKYNYSKILQ